MTIIGPMSQSQQQQQQNQIRVRDVIEYLLLAVHKGKLKKKYTPNELRSINQSFVFMAKSLGYEVTKITPENLTEEHSLSKRIIQQTLNDLILEMEEEKEQKIDPIPLLESKDNNTEDDDSDEGVEFYL